MSMGHQREAGPLALLQESVQELNSRDAQVSTPELAVLERIASHYAAGTSQKAGSEGSALTEPLTQQLKAQKQALTLLTGTLTVPVDVVRRAGKAGLGCSSTQPVQQVRCLPVPVEASVSTEVTGPATSCNPADEAKLEQCQPQGKPSDGGANDGVDMVALRNAVAQRLQSKVERRVKLLEALPNSLPQEVRLKALVQAKALGMAGRQQALRRDVAAAHRLQADCRPGSLLEWSRWRRQAPDPFNLAVNVADAAARKLRASSLANPVVNPTEAARLRLAGVQEEREREAAAQRQEHARKLKEMQARIAEERRRLAEAADRARHEHKLRLRAVQERRVFLAELMNHQRENFRPAAQAALRRRGQRNNGVRAWHSREGRRLSRQADARILALRSNNYEEYVRLARNAKDERLTLLLNKTDDIITELGLKVHEQRLDIVEDGDVFAGNLDWGEEERVGPADAPEADAEAAKLVEGQRRYYQQVHAIREKVEAQPKMLQGGTLRSYQLDGLRFLLSLYNNKMNGILADEMGLGKTIQTISLVAHLMERKGCNGPHLILAPKAVLSNWRTEFARWAPGITAVMYDGTPDERRAMQREHLEGGLFNVLITHYHLAMRDSSALRKVQWEMLMVDEGHRLKNAESKLVEVLRSYSFKQRMLLTGTPIQNSLAELWSLLNFVLPRVFESSDTFDDWFAAPFKGQAEDVGGLLNEEEQLLVITRLHQVLRPFMLRRTKREVEADLPQKMEYILKCSMSAWQKILYQQISEQGRVALDEKATRSLQNAAMHLRKACNHPYLFYMESLSRHEPPDEEELVRASGKLELLDRILPKLRATGHRVLLFSQMTRALDLIQDYLEMRGLAHLRLDGATKTDDRATMLTAFNAPDSDVFLFMLSTRAGGLGLNLQTADTVILFDSDWNPQMDLQAEDRAHRIGQKRQVLVLTLVSAGTIEEDILGRAAQKRDIDAKVIQAGMFNDKSTHSERQQVLQAILRKDASDVGGDAHTEREVNQLLSRSDEEFRLFQQMDRESWAKAGRTSRLMRREEVPPWVFQPDRSNTDPQSDEAADTGEGRRSRRQRSQPDVSYSEAVSDRAFMQALQHSDDNGAACKPPRRSQDSKPRQKAARKRQGPPSDAAAKGTSGGSGTDRDPPLPAKKRHKLPDGGAVKAGTPHQQTVSDGTASNSAANLAASSKHSGAKSSKPGREKEMARSRLSRAMDGKP